MSDEIKEILDYLKDENDYIELHGVKYKKLYMNNLIIDDNEVSVLLDYITNLQERKITKEDVDKYFEENMCVSFDKFIENCDEQEKLTNYYKKKNEELKKKITFNEKSRRKMQQSLTEQIEIKSKGFKATVEELCETSEKLEQLQEENERLKANYKNDKSHQANYNYFKTLYSKTDKDTVIDDLVYKCEDLCKLRQEYQKQSILNLINKGGDEE